METKNLVQKAMHLASHALCYVSLALKLSEIVQRWRTWYVITAPRENIKTKQAIYLAKHVRLGVGLANISKESAGVK